MEDRTAIGIFVGFLIVCVIAVAALIGPSGCYNKVSAWKATAYGSDWFVVQYAVDGNVINTWDLKNCAIQSEQGSDGIFFTTPEGVVHLSGHYVYVQTPTEEIRKKLTLK